MNLREKLFFGFGLYILLAAVFGFFAYRELRAINTRLTFLEMADDVSITMLEVRRYEKNFLLYKDKSGLPELRKYIGILKKDIDAIKSEIIKEISVENYDAMKKTITGYEQWVEKVVNIYDRQERQVELVREAGRAVEKGLSGRKLQTFLVLRRYEKNLMLYKDRQSYDTFVRTFAGLGLGGSPEAKRYGSLVNDLYALYGKEFDYVEKMRSEAREVQSFTVKLSRKERADIAHTLGVSTKLLLFSLLTIILLGSAVNVALSVGIARPIRRLERVTKKVAMGDFSEGIEATGNDEIASLGRSFNQMEERLKGALDSLEHSVKLLQEKQAQLVEAEKLASTGKLCAGIAHEINNPLTAVLTFSHLILEQMPEDDPNRDRMRMMAWETDRARNIVKQLLSFARETPIRPVRVDINEPVKEMLDSLVAQDLFKDIDLVVTLKEGLPEVWADPAQIRQVVSNILLNAVNAIAPPGRVEVATAAVDDSVEISFSDSGCGIPPENMGRIFEPFFTTRETSQGTGLGLAVSYGIVKKHKGGIEVKSEVGKGSTFIVRLPINEQA